MRLYLTKDYLVNDTVILKEGSCIEVDETSILYEMSNKTYKDIKDYLIDTLKVRIEHLFKLFYYKGQPKWEYNKHGWITSCRRGMESTLRIHKGKGKESFPNADKLFKDVWKNNEDYVLKLHDKFIVKFNKTYTDYLPIVSVYENDFILFCEEFHKLVFDVVSKYGDIDEYETEEKIDELLNKYCPFNENYTCNDKE